MAAAEIALTCLRAPACGRRTNQGQGKIDSLKPSSIKPKPDRPDATQPRDPGEPAEETEWGPLASQREMKEYSPNTEVSCDGKDCPYRAATLPGTRGRRGSYFGVGKNRKRANPRFFVV